MGKNQLKIEVKLIVRERVEAGGEPDREAEGGKESDIETGRGRARKKQGEIQREKAMGRNRKRQRWKIHRAGKKTTQNQRIISKTVPLAGI